MSYNCGCTLQAEEVDEEVDEDVLLGLDEEEEEEEDDSGEDKSWRRWFFQIII